MNIHQKIQLSREHRILVMSHRHPDFSLGGGEIAAYNLYKAYRDNNDVADAWFLASADRGRGTNGAISPRRQNEYLWEQSIGDWMMLKAADRRSVTQGFVELLRALRPTIVHAHHYAHLGVEFLRVIKEAAPGIKVYLTLHEYMAICNNQGQMIKTNGRLCSRESLDDCRACFPQHTAQDFWRRKHFIQAHFAYVDHFISPSEFLRQRYIAWGIPAEKISVIENGQDDHEPLPPRSLAEGETRNRFGFFGQINPFKGLDVLLKALHEMSKEDRRKIVLEVHGANLETQTGEFRDRIKELADPLINKGVVQWIGPYQPHELRNRMAGIDWVVVPSVWWENSPMVIQESYVYGRPVISSNIGGMAEKVRPGVAGYHAEAGHSASWRSRLLKATDNDQWELMRARIDRPLNHAKCAQRHLEQFSSSALV